MKYPPTHVLNPAFKYTPSAATNIAITFARVIAEREMREAAEREAQTAAVTTITQLKRRAK